jgi:hypothetical protein
VVPRARHDELLEALAATFSQFMVLEGQPEGYENVIQ